MAKAQKPTRAELEKLYLIDGLSSRQIAKKYICGFRTVLRCLKKYDIQARPDNGLKRYDLEDKDWIEKEYSLKPIDLIAKEQKCSSQTVRRILRKFNIEIKPQGTPKGHTFSAEVRLKMSIAKKGKYIGEANWNWKGGSKPSKERRSYKAKKWREAIKERDNWQCQKCGEKERLHAHHIKGWTKYPEFRYDLDNGVTLCVVCHQKEHKFPFPSFIYNQGRHPKSAEHSSE